MRRFLLSLASILVITAAANAQFEAGNPLISHFGNGATATVPISLVRFTPATTLPLPSFSTVTSSIYQNVGLNSPLSSSLSSVGGLGGTTGTILSGADNRALTGNIAGSNVTLSGLTNAGTANRLASVSNVLTAGTGTFGGSTTLSQTGRNPVFGGVSLTPVPEPTTILGFAAGAMVVGNWIRRRRKAK
jgi:hypothetical protein